MKKIISFIMTITLCATVLAGCGNSSGQQQNDAGSSQSPETASSQAQPESVTEETQMAAELIGSMRTRVCRILSLFPQQ